MVSSGLGDGKGIAAGERDTGDVEGETEGSRVGDSNGDVNRVNLGDGHEPREAPTSALSSDTIDCTARCFPSGL